MIAVPYRRSRWRAPSSIVAMLSAILLVGTLATPVAHAATGFTEVGECSTPGTLCAWGAGKSGALGRGNENGSYVPLAVPGLTNVVKVAATSTVYNHSFAYALLQDGAVWSWGYGADGQLGTGGSPRGSIPSSFAPHKISTLSNVVDIAAGAGDGFGYALRNDGTVWAWGYGYSGQLGNGFGSGAWSSIPIQITSLSNIIAVATAQQTGFALKSDGTVWALGSSYRGILGNGTTGSASKTYVPVRVSLPANIRAIAAGSQNAYALGDDGTVWSWGNCNYGALGNPSQPCQDALYPVSVGALSGVNIIAITSANTNVGTAYALGADGIVRAWGYGKDGQLGNGSSGNVNGQPYYSGTPVQVSNLNNAKVIGAAAGNGYAVRTDGTAVAWGWGRQGVLGNNTSTNSSVPVVVSGLMNATMLGGGLAAYGVVGVANPHAYVALGDSYSSGEGEAPYFEPDNPCHRSRVAYSSLVKIPGSGTTYFSMRNLPDSKWGFLACNGAKIADVRDGQLGPQPQGWNVNDRRLDDGVGLVTITLGGNDLGFADVLGFCGWDRSDCANEVFRDGLNLADWVDQRLSGLEQELSDFYQELDASAPNARFLVMGYPQIFPASPEEQNCAKLRQYWAGTHYLGFSQDEQNFLRTVGIRLNQAIEAAVISSGAAEFVAVAASFSGHEVCGNSGEWINGPVFDASASPPIAPASFHPNLLGHTAYASAINTHLAGAP